MLDCLADNGEMQERRRDDESYMDNRNSPELCCRARKHAEDQRDEKSGQSGGLEASSWHPQESDGLPSIFLAAFLTLIFVSVSMVLICHQTVQLPLRDLKALGPHSVCLPKKVVQSLHLFFPNQLESTWRTVLRYVCNPLGKSNLEEPWILVGTGPGDASQTLLCFSKMMLSLLTQAKSVSVGFLDSTNPCFPSMGSSENRTWLITSVKVLRAEKDLLSGLVVSSQSLLNGKGEATEKTFALLGNGVEQIWEKFLLQRSIPPLISGILSLNPDRRPHKMLVGHENFLVLFISFEQYLESGLVC